MGVNDMKVVPIHRDEDSLLEDRLDGAPGAMSLSLSDFAAVMPLHRYLNIATRDLWPAESVNGRIRNWPVDAKGKPVKPSDWLDKHNPVDQITWAPGLPQIIEDTVIADGGLIEQPGMRAFNLYRLPPAHAGDARLAGPWIEHMHRVYPTDADHLIRYFAHLVQKPGVKINHALVLGGSQGIGKDTMLEPVKQGVGPWNCSEISPSAMLGRFNGWVKAVLVRVSEARDLGDVDRVDFYERAKTYIAAPPDVLRVDEKNLREHPVPNVCHLVITTNHRTNGIYLPADDRRHYVAWSDLAKEDFPEDYWRRLWTWYLQGGIAHVVAYLKGIDLSGFDPKAPPPKTAAFWAIVEAGRDPEDGELADVIEALGNPNALTLAMLKEAAHGLGLSELACMFTDPKARRSIANRLESAGYAAIRNPQAKDRLWVVTGRRMSVYCRRELSTSEQFTAARKLQDGTA